MRTPLWAAAALTLVACGGSDRKPAAPAQAPPVAPAPPAAPSGPEALILRVPRSGGPARVYDYNRLDSAVWMSDSRAPGIARFLAFDDDGGAVAVVDIRGAPRRIEFRTGAVTGPPSVKLTALHSADGAAVYGVSAAGLLTRLTPTDAAPWTLKLPAAARDVAPQSDGSVLVVGEAPDATHLWRVHPPATAVLDTAVLPKSERLVHAAVGDRAYFASDSSLRTVRIRDFKGDRVVGFPRRLRALAPTPSGDRIYIALDSTPELRIVDRYSDHNASMSLPGAAAELRMDPLGRYLLVRPARTPDSVWVVAMSTDRLVGTVRTVWTADLPMVGVDGSVIVAVGPDVVLLDPETLRGRRTVRGGASDFWIPIRWNGFRPRAPGLDQPVTFPGAGADSSGDSILAAIRRSQADTSLRRPVAASSAATAHPVLDSAQGRLAPTPTPAAAATLPPAEAGYTVQFAALLNPDSARLRAAHIVAAGHRAHVVAALRGPATVYLVVLGPFPSRSDAESAARASKQPNPWVYEGAP